MLVGNNIMPVAAYIVKGERLYTYNVGTGSYAAIRINQKEMAIKRGIKVV